MSIRRYIKNGDSRVRQLIVSSRSGWMMGSDEFDTSPLVLTAGTSYAHYLGRWPVAVTSINLFLYLSTAASGAGWGELAVATSAPLVSTNFDSTPETIDLTVRGYYDADAIMKIGSTAGYWRVITPTTPIAPDTDLWAVVACSFASTQATTRVSIGAGPVGFNKTRADAGGTTTRPSLNIGVARTFTGGVGTAVATPAMRGLVLSA